MAVGSRGGNPGETAAQLRAMEIFTPSPVLLTTFSNQFLQKRLQAYEVTQVSPVYEPPMWVKDD